MALLEIALDTSKPQDRIEAIYTRQGDTATVLRVGITDDGTEYDFTGKYVELDIIRPDGTWARVTDGCTHVGQTNVWEVALPAEATAIPGLCGLCYFTVKSEDDPDFRDTTGTFQILVLESGTAEAHLAPYSDQVDRLIQTFYSLTLGMEKLTKDQERQLQDALEAMRKTYREAEDKRDEAARTAEESRQQTFNAAEEERKRIYDAAVKLLNSELGDLDAINAFYLESNWKDTETGFVSTQKFTEFQTDMDETYVRTDQKNVEGGYMEYVPYLEDGAFREAVAGGWPVYE